MKKNLKESTITVRLDSESLRKLNRLSMNNGVTKSEFIRNLISSQRKSHHDECRVTHIVSACQEIFNHIEEKYGNNPELERLVDDLWKAL